MVLVFIPAKSKSSGKTYPSTDLQESRSLTVEIVSSTVVRNEAAIYAIVVYMTVTLAMETKNV
jgi:hypothetical protein